MKKRKYSKEELIFWKKFQEKKKKQKNNIFKIIKGPKKWNIPDNF